MLAHSNKPNYLRCVTQAEQLMSEQFEPENNNAAELAILALHGACGTGRSWDKVRPIWEDSGHHVETPDLPTDRRWGSFDKDARAAARAMVKAGIENWAVIGHSRSGNYLARLQQELDQLAKRTFVGRKAASLTIKNYIFEAAHIEGNTIGWMSDEQKAMAPTKNTLLGQNPSRPARKRILGVDIPYGRPIFGRGLYEFDHELGRHTLFSNSSDTEAARGLAMLRPQRRGGKETIIEQRPNRHVRTDYFVCAFDSMITTEREIWIAQKVLRIPPARIHIRRWDHTPHWADSTYPEFAQDVLDIVEGRK